MFGLIVKQFFLICHFLTLFFLSAIKCIFTCFSEHLNPHPYYNIIVSKIKKKPQYIGTQQIFYCSLFENSFLDLVQN